MVTNTFAQGNGKGKHHHEFDQILSTKIAFFTQELSLTPDEAMKFWAVYNQGWENIMKEARNVRISLKAIKAATECNPPKSDAEIKNLMNDYFKACNKELEAKELLFGELCKIISVEKAARTFIAEEKFRVYLIKTLRKPGGGNNQQEKNQTGGSSQK